MNVPAETIQPGSCVTMHFSITLEDGTIADSSRDNESGENEPITFVMGDGSLVEGLEMALSGLKAGDSQTLKIGPELGFGFRYEENVHSMARSEFADDMPLKPGVIIGFDTPSGEEIPGAIMEVNEADVKVDFNHPLAGHEITFEVEILTVEQIEAANDDQAE